jgi:hypothetical protein
LRLGVYTFTLENQNKFFGLGERKGDFFLLENSTYSLYNNDNDLQDAYFVNGNRKRRVFYGRNGFYPVLYGQMNTDNKLTAVILSDPQRESGFEGKEITFTKPFPGSGRFAV